MNKKNLISLTIAITFLALSTTGILLFIKQKAHFIEITHTVVGLLFVGFAIFHIINNWSSITGYTKERKTGKIKKEFIFASIIAGSVIIGGLTEVLEPVEELGAMFKRKESGDKPKTINFLEITTNKEITGSSFTLTIQKTEASHEADMTVWVEDSTNTFVENILVGEDNLSQWASVAKGAKSNFNQEMPKDNFILHTKTTAKPPFTIKFEIEKGGISEVYESKVFSTDRQAYVLSLPKGILMKSGIINF